MYDSEAEPTDDVDDAIAAVVQVGDDEYVVCVLHEKPASLN
jgi:hypothetical protein